MAVKGDLPARVILVGADTENLSRRRVQHPAFDQFGHRSAGLERRVEGQPRLGPQQPALDLGIDLRRTRSSWMFRKP